jgi:hypothetical protein
MHARHANLCMVVKRKIYPLIGKPSHFPVQTFPFRRGFQFKLFRSAGEMHICCSPEGRSNNGFD